MLFEEVHSVSLRSPAGVRIDLQSRRHKSSASLGPNTIFLDALYGAASPFKDCVRVTITRDLWPRAP